jgi:HlyD family secretion protein
VRNIILIISMLLFLSACSSGSNESQQGRRERGTPTVEAVVAQYGSLPLEERLSGSVRANNQTEIYPEIAAPVVELYINNGDRVQAGQRLIRLRDTEASERLSQAEASLQVANAQVEQAQANLARLENQLNRAVQLRDRNLSSDAAFEELQAQVLSARASLNLSVAQQSSARSVVEERRNELSKMVIKAPISGVVGDRNAEIGQFVTSGTRVFTIGNLSRMKIEVSLTEGMLARIREGMRVQLTTPSYPDTIIMANVTRISPFLNPTSQTAVAEIEVANDGGILRPGMFVAVDIFYGDSQQATLVPNNAIYRHPQQGFEGVFVTPSLSQELNFQPNDSDTGEVPQIVGPVPYEFRRIEVIARGREVTAISGIEPQMHVVTLGHSLLIDGTPSTRVKTVEWEHILNLQQMQSRDLIKIIQERTGPGAIPISTGL